MAGLLSQQNMASTNHGPETCARINRETSRRRLYDRDQRSLLYSNVENPNNPTEVDKRIRAQLGERLLLQDIGYG